MKTMESRVGLSATVKGPLQATFAPLGTIESDRFDLSVRTGGDKPGWVTVAELAGDDGLLGELVAGTGWRYGTENMTFAGTALLRACLWRVLAPAAAFLLERRIPDLDTGNVSLRFDEGNCVTGLSFASGRFAALPNDPERLAAT